MRNLIISCSVLLLCLIMVSSINAQENNKDKEKKNQQIVSNMQLESLKSFSRKYFKAIGFKSKKELLQSSLGTPYEIFMIGIQDIKLITEEHDPRKILIDLKKQIYPVYVGKTLKTSVSIKKRKEKDKEEWEPSSIGKREIHVLEPARKKALESFDGGPTSYFVVRIPAMYIVFLGYYKDKKLYLIQTHKHPYIKFDLYKSIPAYNVFKELKDYVPKYEKAFKSIKVDKSKNTPKPVKKVKKNK